MPKDQDNFKSFVLLLKVYFFVVIWNGVMIFCTTMYHALKITMFWIIFYRKLCGLWLLITILTARVQLLIAVFLNKLASDVEITYIGTFLLYNVFVYQ